MNPMKRILIIDDEPQGNTLEKISNGVKDKLVQSNRGVKCFVCG